MGKYATLDGFMNSLGLEGYIELFKENMVEWEDLINLEERDLLDMGVKRFHIARITEGIKKLQSEKMGPSSDGLHNRKASDFGAFWNMFDTEDDGLHSRAQSRAAVDGGAFFAQMGSKNKSPAMGAITEGSSANLQGANNSFHQPMNQRPPGPTHRSQGSDFGNFFQAIEDADDEVNNNGWGAGNVSTQAQHRPNMHSRKASDFGAFFKNAGRPPNASAPGHTSSHTRRASDFGKFFAAIEDADQENNGYDSYLQAITEDNNGLDPMANVMNGISGQFNMKLQEAMGDKPAFDPFKAQNKFGGVDQGTSSYLQDNTGGYLNNLGLPKVNIPQPSNAATSYRSAQSRIKDLLGNILTTGPLANGGLHKTSTFNPRMFRTGDSVHAKQYPWSDWVHGKILSTNEYDAIVQLKGIGAAPATVPLREDRIKTASHDPRWDPNKSSLLSQYSTPGAFSGGGFGNTPQFQTQQQEATLWNDSTIKGANVRVDRSQPFQKVSLRSGRKIEVRRVTGSLFNAIKIEGLPANMLQDAWLLETEKCLLEDPQPTYVPLTVDAWTDTQLVTFAEVQDIREVVKIESKLRAGFRINGIRCIAMFVKHLNLDQLSKQDKATVKWDLEGLKLKCVWNHPHNPCKFKGLRLRLVSELHPDADGVACDYYGTIVDRDDYLYHCPSCGRGLCSSAVAELNELDEGQLREFLESKKGTAGGTVEELEKQNLKDEIVYLEGDLENKKTRLRMKNVQEMQVLQALSFIDIRTADREELVRVLQQEYMNRVDTSRRLNNTKRQDETLKLHKRILNSRIAHYATKYAEAAAEREILQDKVNTMGMDLARIHQERNAPPKPMGYMPPPMQPETSRQQEPSSYAKTFEPPTFGAGSLPADRPGPPPPARPSRRPGHARRPSRL